MFGLTGKSQTLDYFICADSLYNQPWGAGTVFGMKSIDDNLYVVGSALKYGGNEELNRSCGYWDNTDWHNMGNDFDFTSYIKCVEKYHGKIYVGGGFINVGTNYSAAHCASWNGYSWHAINTSAELINSAVNDLIVFNDQLIIGDVNKESLQEIWHSDKANHLRRIIKNGQYMTLHACKVCPQTYKLK